MVAQNAIVARNVMIAGKPHSFHIIDNDFTFIACDSEDDKQELIALLCGDFYDYSNIELSVLGRSYAQNRKLLSDLVGRVVLEGQDIQTDEYDCTPFAFLAGDTVGGEEIEPILQAVQVPAELWNIPLSDTLYDNPWVYNRLLIGRVFWETHRRLKLLVVEYTEPVTENFRTNILLEKLAKRGLTIVLVSSDINAQPPSTNLVDLRTRVAAQESYYDTRILGANQEDLPESMGKMAGHPNAVVAQHSTESASAGMRPKDHHEIVDYGYSDNIISARGLSLLGKPIDFDLKRGAFIYILGSSGAGKSTLLEMLCGYNKKTEGDLNITSLNWHEHEKKLKGIVGYVPQNNSLYGDITPYQLLRTYVAPGRKKDQECPIKNVLERVKLGHKESRTKIKYLSGGECKRVSIAIELLKGKNMEVLILDEPDSGLDPHNRNILYGLLREQQEAGLTIILTTHYPEGREAGDSYIFLRKNSVNSQGICDPVNDGIDNWYKEHPPLDALQSPGRKISLLRRDFKLYFNDWRNVALLFGGPLICMVLLWQVSIIDIFENYNDSLPIVFVMTSAAILMGLVTTINMVCKDVAAIRRDLRKGISVFGFVSSKVCLVFCLCVLMTGLFIGPYMFLMDFFVNPAYDPILFFAATFSTMLIAAGLGLVISSIPRFTPQTASNTIPFVMIYQMLFSGFMFGVDLPVLNILSISHHTIFVLGYAAGFGRLTGVPVDFTQLHTANLVVPGMFFVLCIAICIMLLKFADLE